MDTLTLHALEKILHLYSHQGLCVGLTSESALTNLRRSGFMGFALSNARYMKLVAHLALRRDKLVIRTRTPDNFLHDLDLHGYLKVGLADT